MVFAQLLGCVEVFCRDLSHLTDLLTQQMHLIPGVRSTETLLIARSYKLSYRWSPAWEDAEEQAVSDPNQKGSQS